jgi:hypothetical protein
MGCLTDKIKLIQEALLEGGLSDNITILDIAKKHGTSTLQIKDQIQKGLKVEREHTTDNNIARKIAMDHLVEDPSYYDKLAKLGI